MRNELEDLWINYLIEVPMERNEQEKEYINKFSKVSALLRSTLNDEQKKYLEEYDNAVCTLNGVSEKYAFIKGVRFAFRLFVEVFCDD